ncbi:MAG: GTPase ObgE [Candidatus Omnitrophota bacterium]|nr:GTPase ObgE [Candidatus Omnitrophota bacterium]
MAMFVDEARIQIQAGDGGKGCESFYKDNFTRHPRRDGGDGGKGGDIVLVADSRIHTLMDFRFRQHHKAERGGHGSSKGSKGKAGRECLLRVPVGTIIRDDETGLIIRDLAVTGERVIVAKGGKGGRGNMSKRPVSAPGKGEVKTIHLELKLIADVGIIGFPNAGKSTLISNISKVQSKIANYPFTTRQPILGVVETDSVRFTVADLPGLIEGAHEGPGLGIKFLKHAERTKILLHLIDMAGSEGRDPIEDFEQINQELELYSDVFFRKEKVVVANKMDLDSARENLKRFKKKYRGKVLAISAVNKNGLAELVDALAVIIEKSKKADSV